MKIADGHVVEFNYTLKDSAGNIIDSSDQNGALPYLHGKNNIIPGLEKELSGKTVGDKFEVKIAPEDGYGQVMPERVQAVPKSEFDDAASIQVGMGFQVADQDGNPHIVTVVEIRDDEIVLDGNHPLAGVELNFAIEIISVRAATQTELDHGHVHSGSCSH